MSIDPFQNLRRHAKHFAHTSDKSPASSQAAAMTETLKLLFNLCQFYPSYVTTFTKAMLSILKILKNIDLPTPVLQAPVTYLVNALLNLDLEDARGHHVPCNPLFPTFDPTVNVSRLCAILGLATSQSADEELEKLAVPLLTLLRRIHEFAPDGVKARLGALLLPTEAERTKPLGQADTLPGRLLRLSAGPLAPKLRESIQSLLFELSERDADRFVRNVGYGFAAGFLVNHGVAVPQSAAEAFSSAAAGGGKRGPSVGTAPAAGSAHLGGANAEMVGNADGGEDEPGAAGAEAPTEARAPVNPVTGQRLDMEPRDEGPPMTEEEKEREAERLFVLFERYVLRGLERSPGQGANQL